MARQKRTQPASGKKDVPLEDVDGGGVVVKASEEKAEEASAAAAAGNPPKKVKTKKLKLKTKKMGNLLPPKGKTGDGNDNVKAKKLESLLVVVVDPDRMVEEGDDADGAEIGSGSRNGSDKSSSSNSDDDDKEDMETDGDNDDEEEEPNLPSAKVVVVAAKATNGASAFTTAAIAPFLDAFYGLASDDPAERAESARQLLQHCLANAVKDASYALGRLLKGLGSGRASARQGNASALTAFLTAAASASAGVDGDGRSLLDEIQRQDSEGGSSSLVSGPRYVLRRLKESTVAPPPPPPAASTAATDSAKAGNKRKGRPSSGSFASAADERDAKLGLLFGIMAMTRSGILLQNVAEEKEAVHVACEVGTELMNLYKDDNKRTTYLKGPVSHAILALLKSLVAAKSAGASSVVVVVKALVERVLAPYFAPKFRGPVGALGSANDGCSAEDVAIVLFVQVLCSEHSIQFPTASATSSSPASLLLSRSILTSDKVAVLAPKLLLAPSSPGESTRLPLVWEALVLYVTDPVVGGGDKHPSKDGVEERTLRKERRHQEDCADPAALISVLAKHATSRSATANTRSRKKDGQHDDPAARTLVLLFRVVAGLEYPSSFTGSRTRVVVQADDLDKCLASPSGMVEALFKSLAGPAAATSPALRSLAMDAVRDVEEELCGYKMQEGNGEPDKGASNDHLQATRDKRLALAKALLRYEPGFDSKTKTNLVARLVRLDDKFGYDSDPAFLDSLLEFIVSQIALAKEADEDEAGSDSAITPSKASAYLDLLLKFSKVLMGDPKSAPYDLLQRFLGCLLPIAFFDCSSVVAPSDATSPKKKKSKQHAHDAVRCATALYEARSGRSPAALPGQVRETASSRFFSIVSLCVTRSLRAPTPNGGGATTTSSSNDRGGSAADVLSAVTMSIRGLSDAGAVLMSAVGRHDKGDNDNDSDPEEVMAWLRKHAEKAGGSEEQNRCFSGLLLLGMTLYLGVLEPRHDEANGPSLFEVTSELLVELKQAFKRFQKPKDECPLSLLSSLLIDAYSSPLMASSQSNGAYPTLLRDVARHAWVSALGLCDADPGTYCKDADAVVNGLLDAIGTTDADSDPNDEDDSDEEDSDDDDDESEDGASNAQAPTPSKKPNDSAENGNEDAKSDADASDDDEEEEMIDAGALQSFLEEDGSVGELEHHEGADDALATFIRAKQDARKAGQAARQRSELENQLRCTALLEALLISKSPTNRAFIVSSDKCIRIMLAIVLLRKGIEKSASDKSSSEAALSVEKRNLLERLTVLLKSRLVRSKLLVSGRWDESVNAAEFTSQSCLRLMDEIKGRCSKEHRSCCNLALMATLRATPDLSTKLDAAAAYRDAVLEWATRRTSRVEVSLFDELIEHDPILAQAVLAQPLAETAASSTARTAYLKIECLRLLSRLYKISRGSGGGRVPPPPPQGGQWRRRRSFYRTLLGRPEASRDGAIERGIQGRGEGVRFVPGRWR
jgi:DNA polymerase phi